MRASLKKTVVGSLAALALGISTVASVAPAFAQGNNNNPGNWQGGHAPSPGAGHGNWQGHSGGNGGGQWQHHNHNGGGWGAAAVGLGVLGLAAGVAAGAQGPYDEEYPDESCTEYRPVYDAYGNYRGRRLVNVC